MRKNIQLEARLKAAETSLEELHSILFESTTRI